MKFGSLLIIILCCSVNSDAQDAVPWYNPYSTTALNDEVNLRQVDCNLQKEGLDEDLGVYVYEFVSQPFFIHTQSQFKKWKKDKFLMEGSAHIYKADKATFLILEIKINSENAKHAYGNLEKGSPLKISFFNNEHIYMENIERDRGKAKKSEQFTIYKGVYPLEGLDVKELGKHYIKKIGIVWEEGYQEYNIQNSDLIMNQIQCVKNM